MIPPHPANAVLRFESVSAIAAALRLSAARDVFDGFQTEASNYYLATCTAEHLPTGSRLAFVREAGYYANGILPDPALDRCLRLLVCYVQPMGDVPVRQNHRQTLRWAEAFFGGYARAAFVAPPATPEAKRLDAWAWRVFCGPSWEPVALPAATVALLQTKMQWPRAADLVALVEEAGAVLLGSA